MTCKYVNVYFTLLNRCDPCVIIILFILLSNLYNAVSCEMTWYFKTRINFFNKSVVLVAKFRFGSIIQHWKRALIWSRLCIFCSSNLTIEIQLQYFKIIYTELFLGSYFWFYFLVISLSYYFFLFIKYESYYFLK